MNELATRKFNEQLAAGCQACKADCCRRGLLFLPPAEYARIESWLQENSPAELDEFRTRTAAYDGFFLYDQQTKCQFLADDNLCRLHVPGVKPTECFWWPFHVYLGDEKQLELRLTTSCCEAFRAYHPGLPVTGTIEEQADTIGLELIRKFRKVYNGGTYDTALIKVLSE